MGLTEYIFKARSGVYKDTPENRRLHRVGQRYGNTTTEHKQPSSKISYEEQESQRQFNKAKELLEALKKRGAEWVYHFSFSKRLGSEHIHSRIQW